MCTDIKQVIYGQFQGVDIDELKFNCTNLVIDTKWKTLQMHNCDFLCTPHFLCLLFKQVVFLSPQQTTNTVIKLQ